MLSFAFYFGWSHNRHSFCFSRRVDIICQVGRNGVPRVGNFDVYFLELFISCLFIWKYFSSFLIRTCCSASLAFFPLVFVLGTPILACLETTFYCKHFLLKYFLALHCNSFSFVSFTCETVSSENRTKFSALQPITSKLY
jgi:hypothetical protein